MLLLQNNSLSVFSLKDQLIKVFSEYRDSLIELLPNLLVAIIVFAVFFIVGKLFHGFFQRRIQKRWQSNILPDILGAVFKWVFYLIGILAALHILGFGKLAGSLVAGAGVSAIIIGFAFKDIAENFLSGLLLAVNRPFSIRDTIEISGFKGRVNGLNLRTTHMRTEDGRDIYIPNSIMVKNVLINFTKDGLLRYDFAIGLDTGCDTELARKLILEELNTYKKFGVLGLPKAAVNIEQIGVSTIDLRVFFWVNAFKSKDFEAELEGEFIKSRVVRGITKILLENNFTMPSYVLEHKLYDDNQPLKVDLKEK